jgi:haloalkane dehalogenase
VLARGSYRCIVPDHIGCGCPTSLPTKPGRRTITGCRAYRPRTLLALRAAATLVVHGSGMDGSPRRRNPQRIARTVINTAFPCPQAVAALSLVRNTALGAFLVRRFNAFSAIAARVAFKKPVAKAVREAYTLPYNSPANRIATLRFVQDIPLGQQDPGFDIVLNTAERLHLLQGKPCLIAWGERDFVFDAPFLNKWREYFPHASVHRLADCGHYVLEDGGAALIDTIVDFMGITEDSKHGHASGKHLEQG